MKEECEDCYHYSGDPDDVCLFEVFAVKSDCRKPRGCLVIANEERIISIGDTTVQVGQGRMTVRETKRDGV